MIEPTTTSDLLALFLGGVFISVFAYAEIHFRLGKLPSYLFKKEPEIIFDLPFRSEIGKNIPLFLFVKDADDYPTKLLEMKVRIAAQGQSYRKLISETFQLQVSDHYFSRTFELPASSFPEKGFYEIEAELTYEVNGRRKILKQDNYRSITHEPFEIYLSDDPLPLLDGWQWGDLHLHSNFTEDQVEFGAPIADTVRSAKSIGLKFLAVTDHSFDFDREEKQPKMTYTNGGFSSQKWDEFIGEIKRIQNENNDFVLLPGEEVSTGNHRKQNIHCLLIGNQSFYPGSGDGAKMLFENRPTLLLADLLDRIRQNEKNAIVAAAHPGDIPPRSQKYVLNRGYWDDKDLLNDRVDYWQILNGKLDQFFLNSFQKWKETLLRGHRIGILAGTDAHGNFNSFRQIKTPLLRMVKHRYQLLGLTRTGVFFEGELNQQNLAHALQKKRVVISNGPIISMEVVRDKQIFKIGDETTLDEPFSIKLQAKSSEEFGKLQKIYLYNGSFQDKKEHRITVETSNKTFAFEQILDLHYKLKQGYIRAEVYTDNGQWNYFCLTNPIWII